LTLPSCQQPQGTSDSENEENEDIGGNSDPIKFSLAKEDLRCPQLNCGKAYSRKHHLIRHFKARKFLSQTGLVVSKEAMVDHELDVGCNTSCECGLKFNNVDQFDKHLVGCQILKAESGSPAGYDKERRQILGTQKELNSITKKRLNELLERLVNSYKVRLQHC
jgi:hypothetical protein